MRINIHAGHNPDGMVACGAVGLIRESTEARAVKDRVVVQLTAMGHTVHDCTCNNGASQQDVLKRIVEACNAHEVDLDVSIHFNAAANPEPDGKTTGTEVLVYDKTSKSVPWAQQIADSIAALGYRNRGVKERPGLYVLKHTKAPALLVECCFVDDPEDIAIYNADRMAAAIVAGITGQAAETTADAARLASMSQVEFVEYIGRLAAVDMQTSGILASVTAAQSILESGYGKSELALNALNLGGMKAELSGNTWASSWDGRTYIKDTAEQREDGSYYTITAAFRAYQSVAAYLADHSAYLAGARAGDGLRYAGVVGCMDYRRAFEIIKAGAYATSKDYVNNLCNVVDRWNLTRFDGAAQEPDGSLWANIAGLSYTWADASSFGQMLSQSGMQTVLKRVKILE
ncbi:N-acetylmuramoyl-L-alanine amidase [Eisenbergiella tayi]|uniref:Exo-glucosaminidase LytG n=1 Tax=Eisenbergiella tayi TaxID=1432052 RepID=A0A1E3A385_9FIRM|nr:N-acetylmuramoyl-L-alanine amidase [Eisenbergiella tayi]ODM03235.1 Exo-glucosaminidase LytG precursor [Eisenbergiella tayi]